MPSHKTVGRRIKAGQGGKPNVKSQSNEFAGVDPSGPEPGERLLPDSEWKQQAQIEADVALAKLFPRNNQK